MLDLSILEKPPELTEKVRLEILPLAPLSMIDSLPGSYYKTLKAPSKRMLTGLFENILGWHIDYTDRKAILKDLEKLRKKQGIEFTSTQKGSTYQPLLEEYFNIELKVLPENFSYDDYWNRLYRREPSPTDTMPVHANGTIFLDHDALIEKRKLVIKNDTERLEGKALGKFAGLNKDKYPLYYSTPTRREYISLKKSYIFDLRMDFNLIKNLLIVAENNNAAYLGNSEGWVDIKMEHV